MLLPLKFSPADLITIRVTWSLRTHHQADLSLSEEGAEVGCSPALSATFLTFHATGLQVMRGVDSTPDPTSDPTADLRVHYG